MNNVVVLGTTIAKRWLSNHCETTKFVSEGGEEIHKPNVIEQIDYPLSIPIGNKTVKTTVKVNRYKMISDNDEELFVRQEVQSAYLDRLNNIVVKMKLVFESTGKTVWCSMHGYITDKKRQVN
jgi:hypothetical protein